MTFPDLPTVGSINDMELIRFKSRNMNVPVGFIRLGDLLIRLIPFELLAAARIFWRVQDTKETGEATPEIVGDIRRSERIITQRQWVMLASRPGAAGVRLRDALLLQLPSWMNQRWGGFTFRITQLLTGHGCFRVFLLRIGKADSALCPFCSLDDDSADHTIQSCPAWYEERNCDRPRLIVQKYLFIDSISLTSGCVAKVKPRLH